MRYRPRVRIIDAVRWQGQPVSELPPWAQDPRYLSENGSSLYAYTHSGPVRVSRGDWLIRGENEIYPCTHTEFEKRYEDDVPDYPLTAQGLKQHLESLGFSTEIDFENEKLYVTGKSS